MNRGFDRQPVFFGDADRIEFGRRLQHVHAELGAETLAYCLMENHYHLLLRTPGGDLSAAMQHIAGVRHRARVDSSIPRIAASVLHDLDAAPRAA